LSTDSEPFPLSHRRTAASSSAEAVSCISRLSLGLSSDLAVNVEACVAPAEDLLHKGKADELFPEKQGEDLMGKDFLDSLVMEMADTMDKSTIRGCAPFGNQDMDMRMEVDATTEGLDHGHDSRHDFNAGGYVQKFYK